MTHSLNLILIISIRHKLFLWRAKYISRSAFPKIFNEIALYLYFVKKNLIILFRRIRAEPLQKEDSFNKRLSLYRHRNIISFQKLRQKRTPHNISESKDERVLFIKTTRE